MWTTLLLSLFSLLFMPPQIRIPGPGGGAGAAAPSNWSLIAATSATSSGPLTTPAIDCTGASLIVIAIDTYYGVATPTDSRSNSYSLAISELAPGIPQYLSIYYKFSPSVSSSMTFAETYGTSYPGVAAACFSGGGSSIDQSNGAYNNSAASSLQPGSITPTVNGELLVTAIGNLSPPAYPFSIDSGFTIGPQVNYTAYPGGWGVSLAYLSQGTANAINPTWIYAGVSTNTAAAIVSIKP